MLLLRPFQSDRPNDEVTLTHESATNIAFHHHARVPCSMMTAPDTDSQCQPRHPIRAVVLMKSRCCKVGLRRRLRRLRDLELCP